MKSIKFCFLSILIFCSACVTQKYISNEETKLIPKGSQIIEIRTDGEPQEIYKKVYSLLIENGFRIEKENNEIFSIASEGKDLGESSIGRVNILIKKENAVSIITLRPEWRPGADAQNMVSGIAGRNISTEWSACKWGETGRPELVFAYFVSFAKKVSNLITYK